MMNTEPTLTVSLDPKFDRALLGTTVHPVHPPRAVYSLDGLAVALKGDLEAVQTMVLGVMAIHGDAAPIFTAGIDKPEEEKSRIIIPGKFGIN
jgi:hypothetical protein